MSYTLIESELYKITMNKVIQCVALPYKCDDIIKEAHDGIASSNFGGVMIS